MGNSRTVRPSTLVWAVELSIVRLIGSATKHTLREYPCVAVSLRYTRSARGFSLLLGSRKSRARAGLVWRCRPSVIIPIHTGYLQVCRSRGRDSLRCVRTNPLTGIVQMVIGYLNPRI